MLVHDDESGIRAALREAHESLRRDEVPVGCVIVHDGIIVGRGHNQVESLQDATAHAEILAIGAASNALGSWRLHECTLYVTLEPCPMCAGAIVNARVETLVYGTRDPRAGAVDTHYGIGKGPPLNHACVVKEGVLGERAAAILKSFFAEKRQKKNTP